MTKKRILNSNKTEYSYKNLSTYWGSSKNHNSAEEFTNLGLFFDHLKGPSRKSTLKSHDNDYVNK